MRFILFTLMSVVCTATLAATVFKWVDENGVTHYSDQPHENAEKVQVAAPQDLFRTAPPAAAAAAPREPAATPGPAYRSCALVEPENDQTFPNASSVSASVQLDPQQRPGDQVFVLLDGARFPAGAGAVTLPVERGTHALQVVVQDSNGQVVCQSSPVSFNVTQPSLLNPQSPVRPALTLDRAPAFVGNMSDRRGVLHGD